MSEESNLLFHTRRELALLEAASEKDEDPSALEMQKQITEDVLAVVKLVDGMGHSGGSVGYFLNLVRKCVLQQNLTPLTGEPHEWFEHDENTFQNKRFGAVFKNGVDAPAYYLDGYVTIDPNGSGTTPAEGADLCYIEFPYTPETKYLPRLSLIPREEGEELSFKDFLFDSAQEVLDYYESMDIKQPPEDENVVRLGGATARLIMTDEDGNEISGDPVCDPQPPKEDAQ